MACLKYYFWVVKQPSMQRYKQDQMKTREAVSVKSQNIAVSFLSGIVYSSYYI
jgi:hypothetical protein